MSLLLQALQKAAKSREGETNVAATLPATDLALEPASPAPRQRQESSASAPTSAQAASLMQAGSVPAFDPLDYAREHYMLTFVALAFLFAVAYATYVYVQINQPFRGSVAAPTLGPAAPSSQAPVPGTPAVSPSAKISGMPEGAGATSPGINEAAAGPTSATVMSAVAPAEQLAPAGASPRINAVPPASGRRHKNEQIVSPQPNTLSSTSAGKAEPPTLHDASDAVETVVIPSSPPKPASDIAVRQETAAVTPVSPTLMRAYEILQSGDHAQARGLYEQVLQAEPRNLDALLGLGAIALNDGRLDDASRYYQQVLELDPRNSYAQAGLISIIGGADLTASESRLKQLIGRDPSAFLYFSLGNLYAQQAQWPAAQQAYFQAFQMQTDNPDYAFNLAIGLEHLGQNRLALEYYRKALELSFKKGHANFDQGLVIQRVGQLSTHVEQ